MGIRTLKVEPNSEAEERLLELLTRANCMEGTTCRLGVLFDHPTWNEYDITDEQYQQVRKYLEKE